MSPTTVGWVLIDGENVDATTLARDEFTVRGRHSGAGVAETAEQATASMLRLRTIVETQDQRLRGVGVTWSGDAAAEAALLMESLTGAGFDNVVPVRRRRAADPGDGPAVAEPGEQLELARGAALALAPDIELTAALRETPPDVARSATRERPGPQAPSYARASYAGALTMLVAGVLTFVVSLSMALSLQLAPTDELPSAERVAEAPAAPADGRLAAPAAPPPADASQGPSDMFETPAQFDSLAEAPEVEDAPAG